VGDQGRNDRADAQEKVNMEKVRFVVNTFSFVTNKV